MMQRRQFLAGAGSGGLLTLAGAPGLAQDGTRASEAVSLLVVMLRGGMDGLAAVPPVGDAGLAALRPSIAPKAVRPLNADFSLHPALGQAHALWQAGQLVVVHASGFGYAGRSHFEGQDVMQSGRPTPYTSATGWLGRAMEAAGLGSGVAVSIPMPLILRGHPDAGTTYPNWMRPARPVLLRDLESLWRADEALGPYAERLRAEGRVQPGAPGMGGGAYAQARSPASLARLAAEQMRRPDGPRVGLIDIDSGFDTHANQGADSGAHADKLQELDAILGAFRDAMGEAWSRAVVVTVTEFGRNVAENGNGGTDHGVGSCTFIAGGLLRKSAVIADWRGLGRSQLVDGRDLPVTIASQAIMARLLERTWGLDPDTMARRVMDFKPHPLLRDLLA